MCVYACLHIYVLYACIHIGLSRRGRNKDSYYYEGDDIVASEGDDEFIASSDSDER